MRGHEKKRNGSRCARSAMCLMTVSSIAGCLLIPASECLAGLRKSNTGPVAGTDTYQASFEVGSYAAMAASADGAVADVSCGPIVVAMVLGHGHTLDILSVSTEAGWTYSTTEIIDASGEGPGKPLNDPYGVAVDGSGNVYVVGRSSNNAFKITPAGTITQIIDDMGDGSNPLTEPQGIAVDGLGNVYVTGRSSNNAFKITPGGTITEIIDTSGDGAGNSLNLPYGVAVDASGNVFVTGVVSDNAFKITAAGAITEIIDSNGDGTQELLLPWHITVGPSGNVYVTGTGSSNAFKITPGGAITRIIDAGGDGPHELDGAFGITVDGTGNVYVSGFYSNNAFKITEGGAITQIIDFMGDGTNELDVPSHMAVDGSGNVYVTGFMTWNAFKITPGGTITEIIDSSGDGAGNSLRGAAGIAVDGSGNVYVAGVASDNAFRLTPESYDTDVSAAHKDLLGDELQAAELYNPSTDDLFFVTFYPPDPVPDPCDYKISMTYRVLEKRCCLGGSCWSLCTDQSDCGVESFCRTTDEVVLPIHAAGGGTDYKDLVNAEQNPTKGLLDFVTWDERIRTWDPVPAVSSWGVVVLTLLVLVGAKAYFGSRSRIQSAE